MVETYNNHNHARYMYFHLSLLFRAFNFNLGWCYWPLNGCDF